MSQTLAGTYPATVYTIHFMRIFTEPPRREALYFCALASNLAKFIEVVLLLQQEAVGFPNIESLIGNDFTVYFYVVLVCVSLNIIPLCVKFILNKFVRK